jgi:CheY-like chemotaxis protein
MRGAQTFLRGTTQQKSPSDAQAKEAGAMIHAAAAGNKSRRPHARRILVVDDHLDTAESLSYLLRDMGHEVEFAINGYAALDVAAKFRPEIVFLDLVLPDFDGCDLLRLLRLKAAPAPMKIIAFTGRNSDEVRRRAQQAGCDEYLLKPLDPKLVEGLLSR